MPTTNCSCGFKEQMIAEIQRMREQLPGKETEWVDLLLSPADQPLCCLLIYLFYYGYCKECSVSLSEEARSVLAPLMAKPGLC